MPKKNKELSYENSEDIPVPVIRLYRQISIPFTKKLASSKVTADQVTYFGFLCYILSAYFFSKTSYALIILAAVFLQLAYISDYIDGSLSRIRRNPTKFGHWLDLLSGTYGWPLVFFGITLGVYKRIPETYVLWLGFLAAISLPLKNVIQNYYTSIFKFAKKFRREVYNKTGNLFMSFRYTHFLLIPIVTLGALFDKLYLTILFCGVYGPLYTATQTIILTIKAKKECLKIQKK